MYKIIFLLYFLFLSCHPVIGQKLLLLNIEALARVKKDQEYNDVKNYILKRADNLLKRNAVSITDRKKKYAPDLHHYESITPYGWSNPSNPEGVWRRKDGVINPEADKYDKSILETMKNRIVYFALAYYITIDNRYYDAAMEQIRVWFINSKTYMFPMMEYAQIVPGKNNNKGRDAGLIEIYSIIHPVLEYVRLLDQLKKIDDYTYKGLQDWCRKFVSWCESSTIGQKEIAAQNNHGIAIDVTLLDMAIFSNYKKSIDRIITEFPKKRLKRQIASDGSMPKEAGRANSFKYHVFNLTHIIDYCIIMESMNVHFYRNNKKIIDSSINFLLSYVGNKTKWPYKEISSWDDHEKQLLYQIGRLARLKGAHKYDKYRYRGNKELAKILF